MNDKEITYNIDLYLETIQDKIKEKKSYERSLFAGLSIVTLFNVFVLLIRNPIAGLLVELLILAFFATLKFQFNQKHEEKYNQNKTKSYLKDIVKNINKNNKKDFEDYIEKKLKENKKNPFLKKEIKKLYLKINKELKKDNKETLNIKF